MKSNIARFGVSVLQVLGSLARQPLAQVTGTARRGDRAVSVSGCENRKAGDDVVLRLTDTPDKSLANHRMFQSGGGADLGRHSAAYETFWNIRARQPQSWPKGWGPDLMNLVGVQSNAEDHPSVNRCWHSPARSSGPAAVAVLVGIGMLLAAGQLLAPRTRLGRRVLDRWLLGMPFCGT